MLVSIIIIKLIVNLILPQLRQNCWNYATKLFLIPPTFQIWHSRAISFWIWKNGS